MSRLLFFLFSLPVLLSLLTAAEAGPACARRSQGSDRCIQACKQKWGWPGYVMGTDPWGTVVAATGPSTDLSDVSTKACHVKSSTSANSATSATESPSSTGGGLNSTATAPINAVGTASASTSIVTSIPSVSSTSFSIKLLTSTKPSSSDPSSSKSPSSVAPRPNASTQQSSSSSTPSSSDTSHTTETHSTPTTTTTHSAPTTTSTTQKSTSTTTKTTSTEATSISTSKTTTTSHSSSFAAAPSGSSESTSQSDINAYLQAHNSVRAQHGASPLTWSDNLAVAAQKWANNCVFEHSGGTLGKFGENLAAGTGGSYGISQAVKSWTDEVSEYNPNNPQASHFTQVVWKGTSQVGCAVQSCGGIFAASFGPAKFFVCEYSAQGNVIGEFPQNVQV